MQGPDLKVGKTDIIDSKGNRVVTETTNENTLDGKSIWTIKQEFDYDNDGIMDAFKKTTQTYDGNTGKLLNETIISNDEGGYLDVQDDPTIGKTKTSKRQYLYETETGRLVKVHATADFESDGKVDYDETERYEYNDNGKVISKKLYDNEKSNRVPAKTTVIEYHENGKKKTELVNYDYNADGKVDNGPSRFEYDKEGNLSAVTYHWPHDVGNTVQHIKFDKNEKKISETLNYSDGSVLEIKCENGHRTLGTFTGIDGSILEIKFDEKDREVSRTVIKEPDKPAVQEGPAKAEEKQGYEMPSYNPYSQKGEKKRPPMMGV